MGNVQLDVQGISKAFDKKPVVENVSFSLKSGDILGLLGPNGAGKTTIIRMLMNIFKPDGGTVTHSMDGHSIKERVGYLPEDRGLVKEVKVLDLIIYIGTLKGLSRQEAREKGMEFLNKMDLQEYAGKKVDTLSKGMTQKVQFIMTLLHDPDVLVLDEPLSGLDPVNQELFRDMIMEYRDRGKAILLSSHQMNIVEELCDRIYMIDHGQEVLYGTVQEIKARYSNPQVTVYMSAGEERFLEAFPGAENYRKGWYRMPLKDDRAVASFLKAVPEGVEIEEMHLEQSSLHQIFIDKVKEGRRG